MFDECVCVNMCHVHACKCVYMHVCVIYGVHIWRLEDIGGFYGLIGSGTIRMCGIVRIDVACWTVFHSLPLSADPDVELLATSPAP